MKTEEYLWTTLRFSMAWVFFWPFLDKLFGLGLSTARENSWINGISPTAGFLQFGTHGPLSFFFQNFAGNVVVDWLFMGGLFLIGLSLLLGVGVRIASYSGSLILFLIWLALLPPEHNPFLDEHLIYIFILIGLTLRSRYWLSLSGWWGSKNFVKKHSFLR